VFTSQVSSKASDGKGGASVSSMVAGMRRAWSALETAGSKVVVIANNPSPGVSIAACVDAHRNHLSACAYDPAVHDRDPAYQTQRMAVEGTGVPMIDMFSAVCPTIACPPVIGNVLVYRRGSHITATYVRSLTPQLARAMVDVGIAVRYQPHRF
jgi:hypothetical protein